MTVTMFEFDNMRACAKLMDAFTTEPAGQAIATASTAADTPSTMVFEGIYSEIPI
jgi:hypothetical protein